MMLEQEPQASADRADEKNAVDSTLYFDSGFTPKPISDQQSDCQDERSEDQAGRQ